MSSLANAEMGQRSMNINELWTFSILAYGEMWNPNNSLGNTLPWKQNLFVILTDLTFLFSFELSLDTFFIRFLFLSGFEFSYNVFDTNLKKNKQKHLIKLENALKYLRRLCLHFTAHNIIHSQRRRTNSFGVGKCQVKIMLHRFFKYIYFLLNHNN